MSEPQPAYSMPVRIVRSGAPMRWRATLQSGAKTVWRCTHLHRDYDSANDCGREALSVRQSHSHQAATNRNPRTASLSGRSP
jgi:hypothetical protein